MGAAIRDGIMALAGVIRVNCRDAGDLLICWKLTEQNEQNRCVADVAPGDLDGPDLQRFLVNPDGSCARPAAWGHRACVRAILLRDLSPKFPPPRRESLGSV